MKNMSLKNYRIHSSSTSSVSKMRKNLLQKGKIVRGTNKVKNDTATQAAKQLIHQEVAENLDGKDSINLFKEYSSNQAISSTDPAGFHLYRFISIIIEEECNSYYTLEYHFFSRSRLCDIGSSY